MDAKRARRLRESFDALAPNPQQVADAIIDRLQRIELKPGAAFPTDFSRKRESITAALIMVIANAEQVETIQGVLKRSNVPVVGDLRDEEVAEAIRKEMLDALRSLAGERWDEELASDWSRVVNLVAGAMFGTPEDTQD